MSIFEESVSYKPFKYPFAAEGAKKHAIEMFWDSHQIELQDDIRQYRTEGGLATPNKTHSQNKRVIDTILCLFTELDKTVSEGYTRLLPYTKNNEVRMLLLTQAAREVTHTRSYALLAETLGFSDADWKLYHKYKSMVGKVDIISDEDGDLSKPLNYAKALTRLYLSEGIGLFAPFATLLNFKRFGLIIGFNDVNQWSLQDETFHVENNIKIVRVIRDQNLSYAENVELEKYTKNLVNKFTEVEEEFINLIGDQEDLSKKDLVDYIKYLGELRLFQSDYIEYSEVRSNPIEWMDWMLSAGQHDNFFEKRVTSYSHQRLSGKVDYSRYSKYIK